MAKIMQSAYLCVIFHVKCKKLLFLEVLAWFLIFGKIQDLNGQDGGQQLLLRRSKAFH